MKLTLDLAGTKCNEYPHLTVLHNQKIVYSDFVVEQNVIELDLELAQDNLIILQGIGKSHGENNKWDTVVDSTGRIIEDKNLLINNICFDGIAMNQPWIRSLPFCHTNNSKSLCNSGMWDNGYIEFDIQLPLLNWIIQEKFIKFEQDQSKSAVARSGESKFDYNYIQEKLNLITRLLND